LFFEFFGIATLSTFWFAVFTFFDSLLVLLFPITTLRSTLRSLGIKFSIGFLLAKLGLFRTVSAFAISGILWCFVKLSILISAVLVSLLQISSFFGTITTVAFLGLDRLGTVTTLGE